ncbi:MAG: hypothetical protein KGJ89_01655 [Patescibacteria group bacterium]|nr:hypothetical protein [Patescibacteria group bacterium]MDE2015214.1 hypothetical protein [Patescibacteria group bacterium]MDE2226641.1 hypothetical protein [Patescibacteria group bacterium]
MSTQNTDWKSRLMSVAGAMDLKPAPEPVQSAPKAETTETVPETTTEPKSEETSPAEAHTATAVSQASPSVPLPDISSLPSLSDDELKNMREQGQQRGQWAQAAAQKLLQLLASLQILEDQARQDPDIVLSDEFRTKRQQIEAGLAQIQDAGGSEELRARLGFSKMLEEIRATNPHDRKAVQDIIHRVLATGRRRVASVEEAAAFDKAKSWPREAIFLGREVYMRRQLKAGEQYTPADNALESTFRHFIEAVRKARKAEKKDKISAMKERGSVEGKLRGQRGIIRGEKGVYYLYSPKRKEGDREYFEGHGVLEVRDDNKDVKRQPFLVIHVLETEGSLNWLSDNHNGQRTSLPLFWLQRGSVITRQDRRLKPDEFNRAVRMIRTLRALITRNDPELPKPQTQVEKQPEQVLAPETPMVASNPEAVPVAEVIIQPVAPAEEISVPVAEAPAAPKPSRAKRARK